MKTIVSSNRLSQLDALRGVIIILMALDHANSFIAHGKLEPELWADLFPNYTGQPSYVFITRLVTHLAAPGFFFLMGVGMVLLANSRRQRGWSEGQIARHLLVRGGLLILLQFLLENPAWAWGNVMTDTTYFGVLYALGGAMIIGVLFLRLPQRWLVGLSAALVIGTPLLLPEVRTGFAAYSLPLRLWLLPGFSGNVLVLYPIIPWLGVMGLGMGYAKGGILKDEGGTAAYRLALWLGTSALVLFAGLRWWGGLGNIRPPVGGDWVGFLNLVKYPPSLTFLLLTLGVNLVLLALLARLPVGWLRPL
ncbi:MAG: heparan-alpha-glucosaminide N-acetyltransferase domain-containing protein, partial [Anaerolineae bacterium]